MSDAAFWNQRYACDEFAYGTAPSEWLQAQAPRLAAGSAVLVPGDGEGRNGVFLARGGHQVTAVDLAEAGLHKARTLAAQSAVRLDTVCADLAAWTPPAARFDAVVAIFLHLPPTLRERVHRGFAAALRPGGWLIIEVFDRRHHGLPGGGPRDPDWLCTPAMLCSDFAALELRQLQQDHRRLAEGRYHAGEARLLRGVWQREG